jgi:PAS domain S-box-containing protein
MQPFTADDAEMLRVAAQALSAVLEHMSARHQLRDVLGGARCRLWHARVTREASGACFWDLRESDEAASRRFLPLPVEEGQAFHSALWQAIPADDRQAMDDVCFRALSREDPGYRQVYRCRIPDGRLHWIREDVSLQPVGGGCYLLVGVCADITEHRLQEEALSASESRFRSLVETCPAAVGLVSLDGTMLLANQAAVLTNGASRMEEMQGDNILSYLTPEDRERGAAALARISELETFHGEFTCVRRDGARFPADVSARLVRDGDGAPSAITIVLRDLSAQKAAEEERARSLERDLQLRRLESLMGLAGGVAHDFNNLLTGVLGHAELAMTRVGPGSPAEESLRHVLAAAHRAADLSRQMLAYSGHASSEMGPLDLSGLLLDSSDLLRASARTADLRLQVPAGPNPWTQGTATRSLRCSST